MGLGSAREVSLDQARTAARAIRQQLRDKIDPLAAKRAEHAAKLAAVQATKTFRECAEAFIADHAGEWRSARHGAQWHSTLRNYVYPKIGSLDVAAIALPHVLAVLEQEVDALPPNPGGKFWLARRITADRTRNRVEQILNWAKARGFRTGDNPASWDSLQHIIPAVIKGGKHHAAVPYAELPGFMTQLRDRKGSAARALEFLTMTAARAGEVYNATWDEIDLDNKLWTIPAAKMKGGKEHRVPLSDHAVKLLQALPIEDGNPHVFIGGRRQRLDPKTLLLIMLGHNQTVHGMRSAFSDWAHERTSYDNHTIELSLAHSVGSEVERAYRRSDLFDKRRRLMTDWAKFCNSTPAVGDNVVSIGRAR